MCNLYHSFLNCISTIHLPIDMITLPKTTVVRRSVKWNGNTGRLSIDFKGFWHRWIVGRVHPMIAEISICLLGPFCYEKIIPDGRKGPRMWDCADFKMKCTNQNRQKSAWSSEKKKRDLTQSYDKNSFTNWKYENQGQHKTPPKISITQSFQLIWLTGLLVPNVPLTTKAV